MDRVTDMTYPSGQKVNFSYNAQGELESIPNLLNNINYNALARITLKSYDSGIGTSLHYNPDHYRLERINTSNSLQDLNYTFDSVGNILSIKDDVASETQSFTYDALDRILTASVSGGYSRKYDYNSIGNIISVNSSGTVTNYTYGENSAGPHALTSYTNGSGGSCGCTGSQPPGSGDWNINEDTSCSGSDIDISGGLNINNGNTLTLSGGTLYLDGDILLDGDLTLGSDIDFGGEGGSCSGGVTYNLTYDENGNVIEGFGFYFDYNNANQLWRVRNDSGAVAEYFYDPNGQRVKKNESGTVTYYVGEHYEVVEYSNGSVVNTSYYFANGERIAKKVVSSGDPSGSVYYYHPDHLGSTSVISNSSGMLVETTKYFPYGATRTGGTQEKYLYNSKEWLSNVELYSYGSRFYRPDLGRFIQPDPIIPDYYNPQSLNRYSYVVNNPLKYVDPTGNWFETVVDIASLGYNTYMWTQTHGEEYRQGAQWDYAAMMLPIIPGSWIKRPLKWGSKYIPPSWIAKGSRWASRAARHLPPSALRKLGYSDEFIQVLKSGDEVVDVVKTGKRTVWLAEGNAKKGWKHIIQRRKLGAEASQFSKAFKYTPNVEKSKALIMKAVREGEYKKGAYYLKVTSEKYLKVVVGEKGDIITAHPQDISKALKELGRI